VPGASPTASSSTGAAAASPSKPVPPPAAAKKKQIFPKVSRTLSLSLHSALLTHSHIHHERATLNRRTPLCDAGRAPPGVPCLAR
jgi:hypothetical protein